MPWSEKQTLTTIEQEEENGKEGYGARLGNLQLLICMNVLKHSWRDVSCGESA